MTPSSADFPDFCFRHTSKKPEKGEVDGVHFYFVKKEVMQKMAEGGQLVEWAESPGGSLTGTAAASLQQVHSVCAPIAMQNSTQHEVTRAADLLPHGCL